MGTLPLATPDTLLKLQGIFNFLAMVLYCPMLIWLNFVVVPKCLPRWTRPGIISLGGIALATLVYLLFFIWYLRVVLHW